MSDLLEPHEICAEERTGDVVWKKTPAGDMAAGICPSDASGTVTLIIYNTFSIMFDTHAVHSAWLVLLTSQLFIIMLTASAFSH